MNIAGGNTERHAQFAIRGRRSCVRMVVILAGLTTFFASMQGAKRAEAREPSKRCEVRSITFSPDGIHIAAFVMNGHDSGFSESRPIDVSYSIAILKSEDMSKIATVPLDQIGGPEEGFLKAKSGDRVITNISTWSKSVAFSRDGKSLYVVDPKVCQIRTWNIASADWADSYPIRIGASGFALSEKSGLLAAVVAPSGVRIWDTDSGHELLNRSDWTPIRNWSLPEFAPDGWRFAVVTKKGVQLRIAEPDRLLATYLEQEMTTKQKGLVSYQNLLEITSLAFSPSGDRLAIGTIKGVRVFNIVSGDPDSPTPTSEKAPREAGEKTFTLDLGHSTRGLAFSPSGKYLATWDSNGLRFYNTSNHCSASHKNFYTTTFCMAFSPDGKTYAVGDSEGNLTIYEVGTDEKLRAVNFLRGPTISSVCCRPASS